MKKVYLLIVLVLFAMTIIYAKDYSVIVSENQSIFKSEDYNNVLYSIKIDSVVEKENEYIFYNKPSFGTNHNKNCYYNKQFSWLGKEIKFKSNFWQFITSYNDTIFIKQDSKVGDEWILADFKDYFKVSAKVTGFRIENFDNRIDSAKVIELKIVEFYNPDLSHLQFSQNIVISKNYGFINIFNFDESPYRITQNDGWMKLITINNPIYQPFSEKDIYNFDVGDEFHIHEYDYSQSISEKNIQTILKVLSKKEINDYNNRFEYLCRKIEKNYTKNKPEKIDTTTYTNRDITIVYSFTKNDVFDFAKIIKLENQYSGYYISNYTLTNLNKFALNTNLFLGSSVKKDSCFSMAITEGNGSFYYKGLGGPYYKMNYTYNNYGRQLVYYKKGTEEWGTPFKEEDLGVSVEGEYNTNFNTIYNPISDELVIASEIPIENQRLIIYDINGINVYDEIILTDRISMSKLFNGIYLFKIISTDGRTINQGKFSIIR